MKTEERNIKPGIRRTREMEVENLTASERPVSVWAVWEIGNIKMENSEIAI